MAPTSAPAPLRVFASVPVLVSAADVALVSVAPVCASVSVPAVAASSPGGLTWRSSVPHLQSSDELCLSHQDLWWEDNEATTLLLSPWVASETSVSQSGLSSSAGCQGTESGIVINDSYFRVSSHAVALYNVPPFISDKLLQRELSRHCKIVAP